MTVTVDTATEDVRTGTTSPQTFSHAGAASGVKGFVLALVHGTSSTDHVSAASYGGVALTRFQRNTDTATEPGAAELWFLGVGVPQGTQTVSYTPGATTDDFHAVAITLLAAGDLEVIDTDGIDNNVANPSVTLQYGNRSAMSFAALYGGGADGSAFTPNGNCTTVHDHDLGAFYSEIIRQTTAGSADFAIGGTSSSDDVAFAAIAVSEKLPFFAKQHFPEFEPKYELDWWDTPKNLQLFAPPFALTATATTQAQTSAAAVLTENEAASFIFRVATVAPGVLLYDVDLTEHYSNTLLLETRPVPGATFAEVEPPFELDFEQIARSPLFAASDAVQLTANATTQSQTSADAALTEFERPFIPDAFVQLEPTFELVFDDAPRSPLFAPAGTTQLTANATTQSQTSDVVALVQHHILGAAHTSQAQVSQAALLSIPTPSVGGGGGEAQFDARELIEQRRRETALVLALIQAVIRIEEDQ